jgi:hypothetical protein
MQVEAFHNPFFNIYINCFVKYIENIGNLVEFTFETENFPRFSQLSCFKKEIHPKKTLKKKPY